jgi:hypothetical protein
MIIYSLLLIVTIMFVPRGLVGVWELVHSNFLKLFGSRKAPGGSDSTV